jgi:hypothetical protein
MKKIVFVIAGLWTLLMAAAACVWLWEARRDDEIFSGVLAAIAVVASAFSLFRLARPSALARLKDSVLAAELRATRQGIETGALIVRATRTFWSDLGASGNRVTAATGVAVNLAVVLLGFIAFALSDGRVRLRDEEFLLCFVVTTVPILGLAVLWSIDEVTKLTREVRQAQLRAVLFSLEPRNELVAATALSPEVPPPAGHVTSDRKPPPLAERLEADPLGVAGDVQVVEPALSSERAASAKPLPLRYVWLAIILALAALANAGRLKGAVVFGSGLGMVIGAAVISLPFGGMLLLVARRLWKVAMSYKEAYTLYFVGAVVGLLIPFAIDAVSAASLFYPSVYGMGFVASTSLVPPLCWASSRTSDGQRIGLKRALLALLILAPFGFAFGFAWARWMAA